MTTFGIVEMKSYHVGRICRRLRVEHQIALARVGRSVHAELKSTFDQSSFRRAWLIDGKLAAVGGVIGPIAASTGYIWLAIAEDATRYPIAMMKEARRQLDNIMVTKHELATTIIGGDEAAKRLAIFLGFHVMDDGPGAPAFSISGRRTLAEHLDAASDIRIPIGGGYAIPMGYHSAEA